MHAFGGLGQMDANGRAVWAVHRASRQVLFTTRCHDELRIGSVRVGPAQLAIDGTSQHLRGLPGSTVVGDNDVGVFGSFITVRIGRHSYPVLPTVPTVLKIENRGG